MSDVMSDVKCPFCENKHPDVIATSPLGKLPAWSNVTTIVFYVYCKLCHARGPAALSEFAAIAAWENRPEEYSLRVELGQAYKKLHEYIPVAHKDYHFTYDASVLKGDISNGRITDEFGNLWELNCPICGAVLQVIEPGIARCSAARAEPTPPAEEAHT